MNKKLFYLNLAFNVKKDYHTSNLKTIKIKKKGINMSQDLTKVIEEHFKSLPDPRRKTANQRHKFIDILVVAICGINMWGSKLGGCRSIW